MELLWNQSQTLGLHPVTLSFREPDKETRFQVNYLHSQRSYFRTGYLVLLACISLFGIAEWYLFPNEFVQLALIRYAVQIPLLLLAAPFFLLDRVAESQRFRSKIQAFLLYLCTVITLALLGMGLLLSRQLSSERMLYGTLAYIGLFLMVYTVLRLRFFYATVHGFISFLALLLTVTLTGIPSTFSMVTLISFGLIVNIFGAFACYMTEMMSRIHFIQGEQLQEEQDKVEQLLLNVLPTEIASRLKQQETIADSFDNATVMFADLVGFTALSQEISPEELVDLLNGLFTCFDELVEKYGAEKIKTIGDAYMAAAGIPRKRSDHAVVIACLALEMQQILGYFNETYGYTLGLRIGIHSGPVVAGVIGRSRFIYDLWGDTVNTASRMESHGEKGHIQVSHDSYLLLKDSFIFEPRGTIEVKGKGTMQTWWLMESNM